MDLSELNRLEQRNEIADILRRAKALIDTEDKWFGPFAKPRFGGRLCSAMAISVANCGSSDIWTSPPMNIFRQVLGPQQGSFPVISWNNAPERTHAEVMSAFDKAIALAEQS